MPKKARSEYLTIGGDKYYGVVVLKVMSWDEQGRPSIVQVGYDDTTFHLEGGEHFVTAYINASAVKTKKGVA